MSAEKQRIQVSFSTRLAGAAFGLLVLIWWGFLLVLSPLILSYVLLLLAIVWFDWHKKGKDVLVVRSGKSKFTDPLEEIQPVVELRSEFLDWDDRSRWPTWSVGPKLFRLYAFFYGPQPFALERSLPIALFFPRFKKPRFFVLGNVSMKRKENLDDLKAALAVFR